MGRSTGSRWKRLTRNRLNYQSPWLTFANAYASRASFFFIWLGRLLVGAALWTSLFQLLVQSQFKIER
jgi:hypothetical protein